MHKEVFNRIESVTKQVPDVLKNKIKSLKLLNRGFCKLKLYSLLMMQPKQEFS